MIANLLRQPISWSTTFSMVLHALILFGVGATLPDMNKQADFLQPLEVVLVSAKSKSSPAKADALAQHNLDGGGNTAENSSAASPLPALDSSVTRVTSEQAMRQVKNLEQEAEKLLVQARSPYSVTQQGNSQATTDISLNSDDLVQRSLEAIRLEAKVEKEMNAYQKMPRKKFIGARTEEYRFAQYVESWRSKVERIGNLNYPEAARQKHLYGTLQLTVTIHANGSLESAEVTRTSGQPILDASAKHIVEMSAPFAPFPPNISKDTDIIGITRTWTFTQADKLEGQ